MLMHAATGQAIPAYLINLARRTDRMQRVSAHMQQRGIEFERVEACDGRAVESAVLDGVSLRRGPFGVISPGHRGCTVSHSMAWRQFLAGPATHALFLEDDISVAADMRRLLQDTVWIPTGADLVKLEKYRRGTSRLLLGRSVGQTPDGRHVHPLRSLHGGAGAYVLSRRGAGMALAECGRIAVQVDHLLFNAAVSALSRRLRPLIVCPGMATQYAVPYSSDTWTRGKKTRPPLWRRSQKSLRRGWREIQLVPVQVAEMALRGVRLREVDYQEVPPDR